MTNILKRKTKKSLAKITRIYKDKVEEHEAFGFYSRADEDPFAFVGYSLQQAIQRYEIETEQQEFTEILYITDDEEIAEELKKLPPF